MSKPTENTFFKTLTSPVFLISLILLVLNDHLFKYQFHNFLTGKISDFAGLLCFVLFWIGLFHNYQKVALLAIGIAFIFWKSEFSSGLINWINQNDLLHFNRVIDYGDLWALTVLPYAHFYHKRILNNETGIQFRIDPVLPLMMACFSFVATTIDEPFPNCYEGRSYEMPIAQDDLLQKMRDNFYTDARSFQPGSGALMLEYRNSVCEDSSRILVTIWTSFVSDTSSLLEVPEFCLECEDFLEQEDIVDSFQERVVNVLLAD